jgi:hypothetical protein
MFPRDDLLLGTGQYHRVDHTSIHLRPVLRIRNTTIRKFNIYHYNLYLKGFTTGDLFADIHLFIVLMNLAVSSTKLFFNGHKNIQVGFG